MQYRPGLPENNVNVSHNHPAREFLTLLTAIILLVLVIYWAAGLLVDVAVDHLSIEQEQKLYATINPYLEMTSEDNLKTQVMLQQLTDELQQCSPVPYPVQIRLVHSPNANALAMPGGTVIIFDGLLGKVHSENGLSFVLAHELGHFIQRDHLRSLGRGIVLATLSAFLTGAGSDISQILAPTGVLGQAQYSQQRESRADRHALQTLACRYGHIGGATEFFETMRSSGKHTSFGPQHYFSSHPELEQRIEDLAQLAQQMALPTKATVSLPGFSDSEEVHHQ